MTLNFVTDALIFICLGSLGLIIAYFHKEVVHLRSTAIIDPGDMEIVERYRSSRHFHLLVIFVTQVVVFIIRVFIIRGT